MRLEKILRNGQAQSSALNFSAGSPEISLEDTLVVTGVYAAAEILHVNIHSPVMLDRPIQTAAALLDLGDGGRIRQRIGLLGQGGRNLLLIHLGNVLLLMGQTVYQNAARRRALREAAQAPFAGGHTGVTSQPFLQLGVFDGPTQQRQNPIVAPLVI